MLLLLLSSLEATMAKLGGCVDELEPDVLKSHTGCLLEKRLPQCYHPLLRPNTAALYHDVVVLHNTIVRETTHWCNILLGPVILCHSIVRLLASLAKLVDFLVHLSTVVVTILTSPSNSV
uniref:Uncharacterized protein n=1 Tax=Opuntia streptacantha TaxID=393608 RepID=A0A7C9CXG9_OPUST